MRVYRIDPMVDIYYYEVKKIFPEQQQKKTILEIVLSKSKLWLQFLVKAQFTQNIVARNIEIKR